MLSFDQLVQQQRTFFNTMQTRNLTFRRNALLRLKKSILKNESEILSALQADLGKNAFEAYASEVGIVLGEIKTALKYLRSFATPIRKPTPVYLWPSKSRIQYEPLGVCLIISPWNYPFQLTIAPLVGAIAAGNTVVLKPSERSPHTTQLIFRMIQQIFHPDHVSVVPADKTTSAKLLDEPFDKIFFTGSKGVGKIVYEAAAHKMIPVTLELGGKNPCIVESDANLDIAANRIAWGKFYNAGQTCVAPDYVLVASSKKEALVTALVRSIHELFGSNPQQSPYYGRLIDETHARQLQRLLTDECIRHGGEMNINECYMAPTIVDNVHMDSPLMEDEIFGPILPIISYAHLDDALSTVLSFPKSLALYLFSRNRQTQQMVLQKCSFGGGCINDTLVHFSSPHLPVGGVGWSGIGRYRGKHSFFAFSNLKTIVDTPYQPNFTLRYPPFPKWKMSLLKRFMR